MAKKIDGHWTQEQMADFIQNNDKVLYSALQALYKCQTDEEKSSKDALLQNGVGFNGVDAPFLSSVAQFLNKNGFLTEKQKVLTRKKLVKYMRQITNMANLDWNRKHACD